MKFIKRSNKQEEKINHFKNPKYQENLADPDIADGRERLRKYFIMAIVLFVIIIAMVILNVFGIINKVVLGIVLGTITAVVLYFYVKITNDNLFE